MFGLIWFIIQVSGNANIGQQINYQLNTIWNRSERINMLYEVQKK